MSPLLRELVRVLIQQKPYQSAFLTVTRFVERRTRGAVSDLLAAHEVNLSPEDKLLLDQALKDATIALREGQLQKLEKE